MAKYIYQEMSIKVNDQAHIQPRFAKIKHLDGDEFIRRVAHGNPHAYGLTLQVLTDVAAELASALAEGCSVTLKGIGRFTPTLAMREGSQPVTVDESGTEHRSNARSVEFGGVNFVPTRQLLNDCKRRCHLEHDAQVGNSTITTQRMSPEERQRLLLEYLDTNQRITAKEYVTLTHLSHTSASRELMALTQSEQPILERQGHASHTFYTKKA